MGMFDSLIDERDVEWQTKAFSCALDEFRVGDAIPSDSSASFQVEILGPCCTTDVADFSFATVRDGRLAAINDDRDPTLVLLNYSGVVIDHGARKAV